MHRIFSRTPVVAWALSLGILGLGAASVPHAAPAKKKTVPVVKVQDLNGKLVNLSLKGRTNLVVFWATWCVPCRAEIPDLNQFQAKYAKKGFSVRAISIDEGGPAPVKRFAQKLKMKYPVYLGSEKTGEKFGGITAVPVSFLMDSKGRVIKEYLGLQDPKILARDIERQLAKKG